jgi:hypothetical protein
MNAWTCILDVNRLTCILYKPHSTAVVLLLQASKPTTSTSSQSQPATPAGSRSSTSAPQQQTKSLPHHPANQHGVVQVCHVLYRSLCRTLQPPAQLLPSTSSSSRSRSYSNSRGMDMQEWHRQQQQVQQQHWEQQLSAVLTGCPVLLGRPLLAQL